MRATAARAANTLSASRRPLDDGQTRCVVCGKPVETEADGEITNDGRMQTYEAPIPGISVQCDGCGEFMCLDCAKVSEAFSMFCLACWDTEPR